MPIHDPLQSEMERRFLLAMVLSMVVLFLVPYFYQKTYPPPKEQAAAEAGQQEQVETTEEPAQPESTPPPVEEPTEIERGEVVPTSASPRRVEMENANLILTWSSAGGILESALLKAYRSAGSPVELMPQSVPASARGPFAIQTRDEEANDHLQRAVYEVQGVQGDRVEAPAEVVFYYRDAVVEVTRKVRIPQRGYLLECQTDVKVRGRSVPFSIRLGPGIGPEPNQAGEGDFANPAAVFSREGSVERYDPGDLEEPVNLAQGMQWLALESKYFAYLILRTAGLEGARLSSVKTGEEGAETPAVSADALLGEHAAYAVFLGPKDYEILENADVTLTSLIDYGWFDFLVMPLLFSLKFVYTYIHNYGWAIIILTFIINLALFPVRYKQMVSMKKMSEVQPQMKAIQDKYKKMKRDDPRRQKMNEEVMALYKKHGVNPLGGCLPLVIQLPFLFAFYRMLYSSIELRGAPFIWWIQDLSRHDPYYVTPILMGVSMVAQQRVSPGVADPTQRRMMMLLPVVFTFFFLNFSSGLVLYFLFSNLFGMMFQFAIQAWNPQLAESGPAKKSSKKKKKKKAS